MKKRSSVLARAGHGAVRAGSPRSGGGGGGSVVPGSTGGAFALTELQLTSNPAASSSSSKPEQQPQPQSSEHQQQQAAEDEDHLLLEEHLRGGGKLLLKGDPAAPLTSVRFNPAAPTPLPSVVKTATVISRVQASVSSALPAESQLAWNHFFGSDENRRLVEDLFW